MSSINPAVSVGQMAASQALSTTPRPAADTPAKIEDAARQFEALLLAQVLHSAHPSDGWLGSDGDSSDDSLADYSEQQLAAVMARNGGLGLARMIAQGLERQSASQDDAVPAAAGRGQGPPISEQASTISQQRSVLSGQPRPDRRVQQ